jgi:hypothetical protein
VVLFLQGPATGQQDRFVSRLAGELAQPAAVELGRGGVEDMEEVLSHYKDGLISIYEAWAKLTIIMDDVNRKE